ncbi:hypothetical protein ACH42_08345 [Endozoicomonas sp. (ex Bugula neritina AB1)]|nr:hypothetical protein ACH42_08345 [Endozoicomonas sp. (ex Bugula neritina AB1)]
MLLRRLTTALIASALTLPVFADNTLIPPASAKYIALDGQDVVSMEIDTQKGIALKDGKHQLVFQLKSIIRDAGDTSMYTSKPYIMTFTLEGDETYIIKSPNLRNPSDIDSLEKAPAEQLSLVTSNGESVSFALSSLRKSGLTMGDLTDDVQKFNLTDDPAAVKAFSGGMMPAVNASAAVAPVNTSPQSAPIAANPNSESMLKYWYNQADESTREQFLKWVSEKNK